MCATIGCMEIAREGIHAGTSTLWQTEGSRMDRADTGTQRNPTLASIGILRKDVSFTMRKIFFCIKFCK
jgi:hypothetical protein